MTLSRIGGVLALIGLAACGADEGPTAPSEPITLTVTILGNGRGRVLTVPSGLECSAGTCSAPFGLDWQITLHAVPESGSTFVRWAGACTGTASACPLVMSTSRSISAVFDR